MHLFILRERKSKQGRSRERETEDLKKVLYWQQRAQCGAWTHKPRDHDLSQSRMLNWLSHPHAPRWDLMLTLKNNYGESWPLTCSICWRWTLFNSPNFDSSIIRANYYTRNYKIGSMYTSVTFDITRGPSQINTQFTETRFSGKNSLPKQYLPAVYEITAISWEMQTEQEAFLFLPKPTCKEFHVLSNIFLALLIKRRTTHKDPHLH